MVIKAEVVYTIKKGNTKELKSLVKEISEKESRSEHHVSYNERRASDKGSPGINCIYLIENDKTSVKNGSIAEDRKKDEGSFFLTVLKEQKKLENIGNIIPKTQESDGGRLKESKKWILSRT
jgi:hypothetical protein